MSKYRIGLEREVFRTNKRGNISKKKHPSSLGSALTHPYITTDFAESQLEIITPPMDSIDKAYTFFQELHHFIAQNTTDLLWSSSLPPRGDPSSVEIARYGTSWRAKKREMYREGLSVKYGKAMQLFSGIHYNFSFASKVSSEEYLGLIRNFLREGWLLTYLFGASPHPDYRDSTSLRMSDQGYYNRLNSQRLISMNSFDEMARDFKHALKSKQFQSLNEFYARIRPKSTTDIFKTGIEYVEVRSLDINPLSPYGITKETLVFLKEFLIYCFNKESPPISKEEAYALCQNQNRVALYGLQKDLLLMRDGKEVKLAAWKDEILKHLPPVSPPLAMHSFSLLSLAKEHTSVLKKAPCSLEECFIETAQDSINALKEEESLERSTQYIVCECIKRGINYEVVDPVHNILRLHLPKGTQIIQQATMLECDSMVTHKLLRNKWATKKLLQEAGLSVPLGQLFTSKIEALLYAHPNCVIKPVTANYGDGVHVRPLDLPCALNDAFKCDKGVIIEEFFSGLEFRFLIIDGKCIGIANRLPAYVIGNGMLSVSELIKAKNKRKKKEGHIKLGKMERSILLDQGYTPDSVPKKGCNITLRKNSNISSGGDAIDMTDEMHPSYTQVAIRASRLLKASVCGCDLIIKDHKKPATPDNYTIIELNDNPTLVIHEEPFEGTPRPAASAVLDLINK